ncbi:hypothetical protein ARSEF1564_003341 [Beauveria bassiana]
MPAHIRAVYMPGIFVTVGDVVRAVGAVCGEEKLALLKQVGRLYGGLAIAQRGKFGMMFLLGGVLVLKEDVVFFKVHTSVSWTKGVSADKVSIPIIG